MNSLYRCKCDFEPSEQAIDDVKVTSTPRPEENLETNLNQNARSLDEEEEFNVAWDIG